MNPYSVSNDSTSGHKRSYYHRYVMLNQDIAAQLAKATELTITDRRVLDIGIARMNDYGHANFGKGELLEVLGIDRTTLWRSKVKLHKSGFLADSGGGQTCIWIASCVAFREGSGKKCQFHR